MALYQGNLALKIDKSDDDSQLQPKIGTSGIYWKNIKSDESFPSEVEKCIPSIEVERSSAFNILWMIDLQHLVVPVRSTRYYTWADWTERSEYKAAYKNEPETSYIGTLSLLGESLGYLPDMFLSIKLETRYDQEEYGIESEHLISDVPVVITEKESLESFLIEHIRHIPEVESLYKYENEDSIVFFTILDTVRYQRDVNMKVYEVEYTILRRFPDVNLAFRCIPRLGMTDDDFLPAGAFRLYSRVEKS